jgi:cell division transport system permease protein
MPESFHVRMTTLAAYQRVRAGAVEAEIRALPGVADIVFQCASVEECRERAPTPR